MMNLTNNYFKIPEELLIEIFVRSSVAYLLRARCVCRQWYDTLRDPVFILKHIEYQKAHDKGRLLLQYNKEKENIQQQKFHYALFDDADETTLLSNEYHDLVTINSLNRDWLNIEGPVNGLYCLCSTSYNRRFVLWNPILMEFRIIPLPHPHFIPSENALEISYNIGFGMDMVTHDYKLVIIHFYNHEAFDLLHDDHYYGTVYNLATNTWRLLYYYSEDSMLFRRSFEEDHSCTFLNGTYFWWTHEYHGTRSLVLFDMADETFREILGGPDASYEGYLTLYNNNNNYVLASLHRNEFYADIWLMLEEGVWVKQFSVTSLPRSFIIIGLWKNDGFLFVPYSFEDSSLIYSEIVLCNTSTQEIRNVGPKGCYVNFKGSVYHESLVSMDCGRTKQKVKCSSIVSEFLTSYGVRDT